MPADSKNVVVTPIFILSLPRSGSTLLQRLIATHPAVATASEPWLMLPLLLGYREGHVVATYRQRHLATAFEDFRASLPDGEATHRLAIQRFSHTFYERACGPGQTHFLDKTPRYHLVADDLLRSFPEARFVLLWRNPLAVAASCIETWGQGRFRLDDHRIDLYDGLARLVEVARDHHDRLRILRYEDLVTEPERYLPGIFAFCGLPAMDGAQERLGEVSLGGRMGDPEGKVSSRVSQASRDAWPATLASPCRRLWARRYLRWVGAERLRTMGYELDEVVSQLAAQPFTARHAFSDLFWLGYGRFALRSQRAFHRRHRLLVQQGKSPMVPFE